MNFLLTFVISFFAFFSSQPYLGTLRIENKSSLSRNSEMVEFDLSKSKFKDKTFSILNQQNEEVPYQITYDNKLIFLVSLQAKEKLQYRIVAQKPQEYKPLTFARLITERKDDFAWENDKVAFRLYGPALKAIDGPSNGLDIWYKRTPNLIIDKWYELDLAGKQSYHADHGEGLDDYKVGPTLGAGAMAPFINGNLILNENFVSSEILENGPLRTTFHLRYKNLNINQKEVEESRLISIDAGSNLIKISQEYKANFPFEAAAGLVLRNTDTASELLKNNTILYQKEPDNKNAQGVHLALVNLKGWKKSLAHSQSKNVQHTLALSQYKPNEPIVYYTGFGWEKAGLKNQEDFKNYLINFVDSKNSPIKVSFVKTK